MSEQGDAQHRAAITAPDAAGHERSACRRTAQMNSIGALVGHGYTVDDLDQLARKAANASRWTFPRFPERCELALGAGRRRPRSAHASCPC
ncbi:hypothetical protein [Actinoplanes sp. ATCC 53533]|uniref:hypothetical protein n=1 Tax=Actinoplanes sp. ATCC 53533 TaxID=1288362 RepID=UPI000F76D479|nr:hypothetical protein [Actinoplanes sp. ATCC 53533]